MRYLFKKWLYAGLSPEFFEKGLLPFTYLFLSTTSLMIGRVTSETLFLSKVKSENLAYMYLIGALFLGFSGSVYRRLVARFRSDVLIRLVILTFIALAVLGRIFIALQVEMIYPVIFLAFDMFGMILMIQFWSLMDEILNPAQAKRLLGIIGSAGIAGGIFAGLLVQSLAGIVGTDNLVLVYAGSTGLILVPVSLISIREKDNLRENFRNRETNIGLSRRQKLNQSSMKKETNRYLSLVVAMVSIIGIVTIIIDYQFKTVLQKNFTGSSMAEFLAKFYIYTGIAALLFQVFLSSRILTRFGLLVSLVAMPFFLFLSSVYVGFIPYLLVGIKNVLMTSFPILVGVTAARFNDRLFSDTLYNAAHQLLYIPFPAGARKKAKVFIGAIVKPASKGFTALVLIASINYFPLGIDALARVCATLLFVSFFLILRIKKEYGRLLIASLDTKILNPGDQEIDVNDSSTLKILYAALKSQDEREVLYALEVLGESGNENLPSHIVELLGHHSAYVRRQALYKLENLIVASSARLADIYIVRISNETLREKIRQLIHDPSPHVQGQAVITLASLGNHEDLSFISTFLENPDLKIRGAAIIALVRYFGIDGMFYGLDAFRKILHHRDIPERIEAAHIIGRVGISNFYRPLLDLLNDTSIEVSRGAVNAAGQVLAPELVEPLIQNLSKNEIKRDIITVLAKYPEPLIVPLLESIFREGIVELQNSQYDETKKNILFSIPRILVKIATDKCFRILFDNYKAASDYMRSRILDVMTFQDSKISIKVRPEKVEGLIDFEIHTYRNFQRLLEQVQGHSGLFDVAEAVKRARYHTGIRILQLLTFLSDPDSIYKIMENLFKANALAASSALEALDNLLKGQLRKKVMQNFTHLTMPEAGIQSSPEGIFLVLETLSQIDYEWLQKVSLYTALNLPVILQKESLVTEPGYLQLLEKIHAGSLYFQKNKIEEQVLTVKLLRLTPFFKELSGESLLRIAEKTGLLKLAPGTSIFHKDDNGDSMYIVVSGKVRIHNGPKEVETLGYGRSFGEISLLDSERRSASATTLEPTELLHLDSKTFYSLIYSKMEIAMAVIRSLNSLHRAILEKLNPETRAEEKPEKESDENLPLKKDSAKAGLPAQDDTPETNALQNPDLVGRIITLKKIELFSGLDDRDLALIGSTIEEEFYEPGEDIVREEEPGSSMYLVGKGSVKVEKKGILISILKTNDYFGEMSLIDNARRSATVTAVEKAVVWKISAFEFYNLLSDKTSIIKNMAVVLSKRIRNGNILLANQERA